MSKLSYKDKIKPSFFALQKGQNKFIYSEYIFSFFENCVII